MTTRQYSKDLLQQARIILDAWNQISPTMAFGDLTVTILGQDIQAASTIDTQIDNLETQLIDLRNQRHARYDCLWDEIKRVRAGVKSIYGDNSSQYEMVGGTRLSERKPYARRSSVTGQPE